MRSWIVVVALLRHVITKPNVTHGFVLCPRRFRYNFLDTERWTLLTSPPSRPTVSASWRCRMVESLSNSNIDQTLIPVVVNHTVFRQVYPELIAHIQMYGHPNIPLGSSGGRKCSTLRRLWKEAKLSKDETDLLERLNFRFVSFDDIYYEADFDDMLTRLEQYECETKNNYQVPKKYASDVELGAWVANVRRLGPNKLFPEHSIKLESLKFSWKSTRKCGSSFMSRYREVQKRVEGFKKSIERERDVVREENSVRGNDSNAIATDSDLSKWMAAQKEAWKKGNLSEARVQYLDQLTEFGFDWKTDKF